MSQINNITYLNKQRPTEWRDGSKRKYLSDLELFVKQVYENLTGINQAKAFTVATLPNPASYNPENNGRAAFIYVSDEAGGATLAFCDGTDWRRVQDRAVVS